MDLDLPKKRIFKRPAALWKRLAAFVFDLILIDLVIALPFERFFRPLVPTDWGAFVEQASREQAWLPPSALYALFAVIILALCYFALFEHLLRQTIGMSVLGIYVDGPVTFWKGILRNVFIIPLFPFYILWFVEPLHLLFYKKRFLERITATETVEVLQAY